MTGELPSPARYVCQLSVHPPALLWRRLRLLRPQVRLLDGQGQQGQQGRGQDLGLGLGQDLGQDLGQGQGLGLGEPVGGAASSLHYDEGSTIRMTCRVHRAPLYHASVRWQVSWVVRRKKKKGGVREVFFGSGGGPRSVQAGPK